MTELVDLLRSIPATTSGVLAHKYLKNRLLLLAEATAASLLDEQPNMRVAMMEMLGRIESHFTDGFDPSFFIVELASLEFLDTKLRDRLLVTVQQEYLERFRPEQRLAELRSLSDAFVKAFEAWHSQVTAAGVNVASTPLWNELREKAVALRELLEDPELSTRWIP